MAECDHVRLRAEGYNKCPGCGEMLSIRAASDDPARAHGSGGAPPHDACAADHAALLRDGFLECPSCEANLSMERVGQATKPGSLA